jgi:large subunit ribosomal protein L23
MADLHIYDVLIRPVITEKSSGLSETLRQYAFEVAEEANKMQIKEAVEFIFEVEVQKVRTMIVPSKRGTRGRHIYRRKPQWKKALVTLKPGHEIKLFNV